MINTLDLQQVSQINTVIKAKGRYHINPFWGYDNRLKFSNSTDVNLSVSYKKQHCFNLCGFKQLWNPLFSVSSKGFIDVMEESSIDCQKKTVIDLGCGSGIIGLNAIRKQAKSVLFSDISTPIKNIASHYLVRPQDSVMVQDLLSNTSIKADLLFFSFGYNYSTVIFDKKRQGSNDQQFIAASYQQIKSHLNPRGQFIGFCFINELKQYEAFCSDIEKYFDLKSLRILKIVDATDYEKQQLPLVKYFGKYLIKQSKPIYLCFFSVET